MMVLELVMVLVKIGIRPGPHAQFDPNVRGDRYQEHRAGNDVDCQEHRRIVQEPQHCGLVIYTSAPAPMGNTISHLSGKSILCGDFGRFTVRRREGLFGFCAATSVVSYFAY